MANRLVAPRTWWGLLVIYSLVCLALGWIAFFHPQYNPAHAHPNFLKDLDQVSSDTRAFVLETLKGDATIFAKMHEFAQTSFNIALGGLLAFLSSSASQILSGRHSG